MLKLLKMLGLVAALVAVFVGVALTSRTYLDSENEKTRKQLSEACPKNTRSTNYLVVIENSVLSPANSIVRLCDTMTVINNDAVTRTIAFGEHDSHISYDNHETQNLEQSEKFTFTLSELGTYELHDHLDERVGGMFSVVKE